MKRYINFIITALVLGPVFLGGCGGERRDASSEQKLSVFVSILPLSFFAERIAGGRADVQVLVGPGQSPETFEPTAKQMARVAGAKAFFSVGVPFEDTLLPRIKNIYPSVEIVDTGVGITLRELGHSSGRHDHDPHVWLDPRQAKTIARNIYETFIRLDPGYDEVYRQNYEKLLAELDGLDAEIAELMAPLKGTTMLVYHPAYGYFAERYGLIQVAIEEGGVTPGSKHIARLLDGAEAQAVKVIFVQPQFSRTAAQTLATKMGAKVFTVDPLSADYASNLRKLAITIRTAYTKD